MRGEGNPKGGSRVSLCTVIIRLSWSLPLFLGDVTIMLIIL